MLNRPLRLTRPEALALLMSLQLLDPEVDPKAVDSLKTKIEALISCSVDEASRLEDSILLDRPARPMSAHFDRLRKAVERRRKVLIQYYTLGRNETAKRIVHPYFLMKSLDYWYLTGYCELRKDLRTFKFERILNVKMLPNTFPPPQDSVIEAYKKEFLSALGRRHVEIFFDSEVAPWIQERYGSSVRQGPDGGVILTLSSDSLEFPSRLVLAHAPHARPLSPPELVAKVAEDVQRVLEIYPDEPSPSLKASK